MRRPTQTPPPTATPPERRPASGFSQDVAALPSCEHRQSACGFCRKVLSLVIRVDAIRDLDHAVCGRGPLESSHSYDGATVAMDHVESERPRIDRGEGVKPREPVGGHVRPVRRAHGRDLRAGLLDRLEDQDESLRRDLGSAH